MQAGPFNREKEKSIPQNGTCWPECRGLPRRQPSRAGTQDESALEKEVMFRLRAAPVICINLKNQPNRTAGTALRQDEQAGVPGVERRQFVIRAEPKTDCGSMYVNNNLKFNRLD
jgi:hypothetical protein